jgi:hypothetical protein
MTAASYDILGIGNAIVDVVARTDDGFLSRHDMHKGAMILIDAAMADTIYAAMPPGQESSGGSAANTCAVAAGLGSRVAYIGKVAGDQLGGVFRHDINAVGVHFPTAPLSGGAPTARCLILVTPDGQRTMNTHFERRPTRPMPPAAASRCRCPTRSASTGTDRRSSSWWSTRWTSCSPMKPSSPHSMNATASRKPPKPPARTSPWRH